MEIENDSNNSAGYINQNPPKTWLVESILVTVLCCLPFGIAGIVYASRVESLFYAGRIAEAEKASRDAGKWTKIGFWLAIAGYGFIFLIYFVFGTLFFLSASQH